jgi:hypothetical protein
MEARMETIKIRIRGEVVEEIDKLKEFRSQYLTHC